MNFGHVSSGASRRHSAPRPVRTTPRTVARDSRPVAAFRQRGWQAGLKLEDFSAPETWHEPAGGGGVRYVVQAPGAGFHHAVGVREVQDRLALLPERFTRPLGAVQFSAMTRKRQLFPCYGMQWGSAVYLYPIEDSLTETYRRPPTPQQQIEARMFGGRVKIAEDHAARDAAHFSQSNSSIGDVAQCK